MKIEIGTRVKTNSRVAWEFAGRTGVVTGERNTQPTGHVFIVALDDPKSLREGRSPVYELGLPVTHFDLI